ncbi:hypothetical protein AVEN_201481-1 [Araneus ventricosus]|uniref:Uncharacterized protein n=1 Tax=Araneus ventricosus TaxID=182803 RepID=A0A4Y2M7T4_ARAVE|nr:hypothetical protein AVEN_254033-1 [Araneus ventricosus]GBN23111.1 hypothetical protein AVEN_61460-1 [Araneus ventricosus]GBN23213.1 hypothetical protein AVEN_168172-1 [Araneus ventricosus]GBN23247.1 hypothetical protein AVEN_201481-1 [Araneus ventricosus]
MQLNWIKALVGFLGNEAADNLAIQATKEGTHLHLQAPKCHLKKMLRNLSLKKWQQEWDPGDTGRAIFNILPKVSLTQAKFMVKRIHHLGYGPRSFTSYLYRFRLHHSDTCACGEKEDATSCHMTLSYHFTKPSAANTQLWWKGLLSNKLSRIKIAELISFLIENVRTS